MKKYMLMLLAGLLAVGMVGCAGSHETKEAPDDFADAQSAQTYLEEQNEIYMQTGKTAETFPEPSGRIPTKTDRVPMP